MSCVDSMTCSVSEVSETNLEELWDKDVSCEDSMTCSVSVVSETKLEELWDKDVLTQILGGVLKTLQNLEPSALKKFFFIASESNDLLPQSASTFSTLGDISTFLLSTRSDYIASA